MKGFGNIKFESDKIYEQIDSELDLDNDDIEIDGDIYKLCGHVFRCGEYNLYSVKGNIFEESEDSGTDEIVQWGDGKYYMRWKPGTELKLERDNQEIEDKPNFANPSVCSYTQTYKSIKG